MAKKGGYQMVVLATLTYAQALAYVDCGKPLLIYDGVNKPYYADSIEVDSDENVVIRKGASSIVVALDGTQTFTNVLNGALMENIIDKDGHNRFIEDDINLDETSGVTNVYGKWSLSGSHLMIVLSIKVDNTTNLSGRIANISIPKFIYDKIFPSGESNVVDYVNVLAWDSTATTNQTLNGILYKGTSQNLVIAVYLNATADRYVRISFDLLIDNE